MSLQEKDARLGQEIQYIGRVLGDVIRGSNGDAIFDTIEHIRKLAVGLRRADNDDGAAGVNDLKQALANELNALTIEQTLNVVRAFSHFSLLANIAEDRHQNRRRRAHRLAGSPAQSGSLRNALETLATRGIAPKQIHDWLNQVIVSAVLTAHPTEVQRKTVLDCEREINRLLTQLAREDLLPEERADAEGGLRRVILQLWQTAMLRLSKLRVVDEIENGLSFYRYTFLSDRKSTRLNSSHERLSRMPSSA